MKNVCIVLLGGCGNQMFQAAYGLALATRGYHVTFSKDHLMQDGHKVYSLDLFKIGKSIKFEQDPAAQTISEHGLSFNPDMLNPPDPSVVFGYWQSEKYFQDIRRAVLFAFEPAIEPPADVFVKAEQMRNESSVFLHVRRGDYTTLQHFHGMMPLEYYRSAMDLIEEHQGPVKPFLFSDDPKWCHANMPCWAEIVNTGSKLWDLWLMSQTKHAICANSSYSWWGSWLGDGKPGRVVVAPKQWFTDKNTDARDIIPDRWVKL